MTMPLSFAELGQFWLAEADAGSLKIARASPALAPHSADPGELAVAFADLFLLNVYPYAGVFLDAFAELNSARAHELDAAYAQYGYAPAALRQVAAPDHIGLLLGLIDLAGPAAAAGVAARYALDWAPVLCLAVEREPSAHPFYRSLAALTRRAILSLSDLPRPPGLVSVPLQAVQPEAEDEVTLKAVVRHLLTPARCGMFLSRARLGGWARNLAAPVPFGERFGVALTLFTAAGAAGTVLPLLDVLEAETRAWSTTYTDWAAEWPAWAAYGAAWQERLATTMRLLADMRRTALAGADWDTENADVYG